MERERVHRPRGAPVVPDIVGYVTRVIDKRDNPTFASNLHELSEILVRPYGSVLTAMHKANYRFTNHGLIPNQDVAAKPGLKDVEVDFRSADPIYSLVWIALLAGTAREPSNGKKSEDLFRERAKLAVKYIKLNNSDAVSNILQENHPWLEPIRGWLE